MPKLTEAQRADVAAALAAGDLYRNIASQFGISINTVAHHAKRLGYRRRSARRSEIHPGALTPFADEDETPGTLRGTPPWMRLGACRDTQDPDLFYPRYDRESGPAKHICQSCPVRTICLDWAVSNREVHGVWGATSERERLHLISQDVTAC